MALLNEANRVGVWETVMRDNKEAISVVKLDLRAAVDAADQWAEDNQASFNSALPLPARTELTAKQKALLLMEVIKRRYVVG